MSHLPNSAICELPADRGRELDVPRLLAERGVVTHFQPMVRVCEGQVWAVEALSRGIDPETRGLVPPDRLFRAAEAWGLVRELDRLCRETALDSFASLGLARRGVLLSLNYEVSILDQGDVTPGWLEQAVQRRGLAPSAVVVEVRECRVRDTQALLEFVEFYRRRGFLLALDDMGAGHSNLERVATIRPEILKVDRSLIQGLDSQYYKQEVTRSLLGLARRTGALLVAEGVETQAEAVRALELGADLQQGFYYARPHADVSDSSEGLQGRMARVADSFRQGALRRYARKRSQARRFERVVADCVRALSLRDPAEFDPIMDDLVNSHPELECIYILDTKGTQVSRTACNQAGLGSTSVRLFRAAHHGDDLSHKEYYLLLAAGLDRYVSPPYISHASGNLCVTYSCWFQGPQTTRWALCADFQVERVD